MGRSRKPLYGQLYRGVESLSLRRILKCLFGVHCGALTLKTQTKIQTSRCMPDTNITYTKPVLCTYDNSLEKEWFVYFDITDTLTNITKRKQFRNGINYYKTLKDRLIAGEQLCKYWEEKLKTGWSPFLYSVNRLNKMGFVEAIDFALSKCQVSKKTKLDYECTANFFKDAAKKLNLHNAIVTGIKRQHIKLLLEQIKTNRKWSNFSYNKNLGYFSGILSRLVEFEIIEHSLSWHKIFAGCRNG